MFPIATELIELKLQADSLDFKQSKVTPKVDEYKVQIVQRPYAEQKILLNCDIVTSLDSENFAEEIAVSPNPIVNELISKDCQSTSLSMKFMMLWVKGVCLNGKGDCELQPLELRGISD